MVSKDDSILRDSNGREIEHHEEDSVSKIFPHPWSVKRSRRCVHCLDKIRGVGYSEAYKNLISQPRQCQKCAKPLCKDHLMVVCRPCIQSVVIKSGLL